jgi:hypothetical protein
MKTFKTLRVDEGTNARQRGEVQSPRSQKEYDALSPKDKKLVDARTKRAFKQSISRQPGESPRNKRSKRKRKNFEELDLDAIDEAKKKGYPETPRQKKEREAWEKTSAGVHSLRKRKSSGGGGGGKSYPETPRQKKEREAWKKSHPANEEVETNVSEAWGSTNPKVPFTGEYEVEFAPNSVTGRSAFYVDHDEGDKEGRIYVKTDYKGKGDTNVDERKFIATLKKHLADARKAGERVNVEVHEIGNMGFKSDRSRR